MTGHRTPSGRDLGVGKAVVLAAGLGSRLGTRDVPKPLLDVAGEPMLCRALRELADAGVRETVVVVGHRREVIEERIGDRVGDMAVTYVASDRYATTNNAYSLWTARHYLTDDCFVVEGDVLFEGAVLNRLAASDADAASAVAAWTPAMHGTVAELGAGGAVVRLVLPKEQPASRPLTGTFKTVNVHLLRRRFLGEHFVPALDALIAGGQLQEYYEVILADVVRRGEVRVHGVDCTGLRWFEVDDAADRIAAEHTFAAPEHQRDLLMSQHGSYWRHGVTDHALLYNLYFPPPALLADLAANFTETVTHYPAGQRTHARLLGGIIRQDPNRLVVANGAAELIKVLGRVLGPTTVVVPNFNEYESVFPAGQLHRFHLTWPGFELDVDALVRSVRLAGSRAVVITTPNNPTSIAVTRADLARLCDELAHDGVTLVVDESFVDFCANGESLEPELDDHPNLVVVKSMSKVYGIGGVRLGYLLSADTAFVAKVRGEIPIWNINGVAEEFLRLLPRYRRQFAESCELVRADRDELYAALAAVPDLTVCRPDANYVFVRLPEGWRAADVAQRLFMSRRILVKECSGKSMADGHRWLRLSSRTTEENRALVAALRVVLAEGPAGDDLTVEAGGPDRDLVAAATPATRRDGAHETS